MVWFYIHTASEGQSERMKKIFHYDMISAVSDLENIHCISTVFDGLSTGTNFILSNLIAFVRGSNNIVAMSDCNHAAKN